MDVRLPRLGEGADSGSVATVFVKEGDLVRKDQPLFELESEKAVATIPSPAAGRILKLYIKEGDQIKVGQLIAGLSDEGAPAPPAPVIDASAGDDEEGAVFVEEETPQPAPEPPAEPALPRGVPPPASPTVRKLSRELGIDLTRVRGSERGGRIVVADLKRYIQSLQQTASRPPAQGKAPAPRPAAAEPIDFGKWGSVRRKSMTTIRKTISARMTESWTTIPHITQFDEADITAALALRKKYAQTYEKKKGHLTLTGIALKAVVAALKNHPLFNASIDEQSGEIVYKNYYHIGIAVDTEHGLIVPVIRDVDKKSLLELSVELSTLADRTRQRKVGLDEMQGGSFTISNQGGIGSGFFTPIINKPEVAILGIGRSVVKPVVIKGAVRQRTMMPLGLSYDHRLIDGADAARFMVDLVRALEDIHEADVRI